jgi:hypothetical protein
MIVDFSYAAARSELSRGGPSAVGVADGREKADCAGRSRIKKRYKCWLLCVGFVFMLFFLFRRHSFLHGLPDCRRAVSDLCQANRPRYDPQARHKGATNNEGGQHNFFFYC